MTETPSGRGPGSPKGRPGRPPRLAEALLGLLLPRRHAEQVLGDLEEEYRTRVIDGRLAARVWFWSQVARSAWPALRLRRLGRREGGMGAPTELFGLVAQGIALAARGVRRAPGFTLAVVATLALGLGANTTMFGIVDRLLLRPPEHVRDPDRVRLLYFERLSPFMGRAETSPAAAYPDLIDMTTVAGFDGVAGYGNSTRTVGSGADAEKIRVQLAGASLFELLGVRPELGRFYGPEEDRVEGGEAVAVLSHAYWSRRFGANPDIVGRDLRIGRATYTVVGVAPGGFTGPTIEPVDAWLPLLTTQATESGAGWANTRRWYWFAMVARLRDGVSPEAALAEATAAHRAGRSEEVSLGRYDPDARVILGSLVPGRGPDPGDEIAVSRWLAGVALVVLLIACANVANLLLVRAVKGRREIAVRLALGISGRRLIGTLVVESVVLGTLAAVAAVAVARWSGSLVYRTLLPHLDQGSALASPRLLVFAGVTATIAALLAGVVPAIRASLVDPGRELRHGGVRSTSTGRVRAGLLLLQVGLSMVLLAGAGVFMTSLARVHDVDLGFDPEGVLIATAETEDGTFNARTSEAVQEAMVRLRRAPGVSVAAVSSLTPFRGLWGRGISLSSGDSVAVPHGPYYYTASADYFDAMGMRIVRGRGFTEGDMGAGSEPVTVLTQDLARRAFGARDPLGQCILIEDGDERGDPPCTTVVGTRPDHRSTAIEETETLLYYVPVGHPAAGAPQTLVVKTEDEAADVVPLVRSALLESVPGVRYAAVSPMTSSLDARTRSWRLGATLFAVFGGLALLVAALGLYALIAFDVAQKRHEIGIRSALGAAGSHLVRTVLARAVLLTVAGSAFGLVAIFGLARYVEDLLFEVTATDPAVLGLVALVLLLVAGLAAAIPAARATRVPPAEVLRTE